MWKNFFKIIGFEREAEKQEIAAKTRTNKPKTIKLTQEWSNPVPEFFFKI